jgi:hypothetical protein
MWPSSEARVDQRVHGSEPETLTTCAASLRPTLLGEEAPSRKEHVQDVPERISEDNSPRHTVGERLLTVWRDAQERAAFTVAGSQ